MMKVASQHLSAINLFIILLGFHNISVSDKELNWILYDEVDKKEVIKLSK
jgi:hypothetical protein